MHYAARAASHYFNALPALPSCLQASTTRAAMALSASRPHERGSYIFLLPTSPSILIGAQWGDEGKGKATDLIGTKVDYVARFNGGNNAGHTVVVGDESYALHLLPSGIISPTATGGTDLEIGRASCRERVC